MNVHILEERLEEMSDENFVSVVQLIIAAVKDYPVNDLIDTDLYFDEVKKIIGERDLTLENLDKYIDQNSDKPDEKNLWIISSLSLLADAFQLMHLYDLNFNNIVMKIETL